MTNPPITDPRNELRVALNALQDAAGRWDIRGTIAAKLRALACADAMAAGVAEPIDVATADRIRTAREHATRQRFIAVSLDLELVDRILARLAADDARHQVTAVPSPVPLTSTLGSADAQPKSPRDDARADAADVTNPVAGPAHP